MKAQVFYEPERMQLTHVDDPRIAADEVLIRVKACGICGSDVAYYWGASSLETEDGKGPLILGHEFTGEVVQVGEIPAELGLFEEGDRVVVNPVQYCGACEICQRGMVNLCENKKVLGVSTDGGFAELSKSKYMHAYKLPENVTYEQGALTEPLACSVYATDNLNVRPGGFYVVFGPGPIGLLQLQLINARGAGTIVLVGTRDYRLEMGRKLGADVILNTASPESPHYCADPVAAIRDMTNGKMADGAITSTSSLAAMHAALDCTGRRATIVFFGLPGDEDRVQVPALDCILWDKTIRFSWLAPLTWPAALNAIATGLVNVNPLITHRYPLEDLLEGLQKVRERVDEPIKDLVIP